MDKRFLLFIVIAFTALAANSLIMSWLFPPPPVVEQLAEAPAGGDAPGDKAPDPNKAARDKAPPDDGDDAPGDDAPGDIADAAGDPDEAADDRDQPAGDAPPGAVTARRQPAPQWFALGSADPASDYRALVIVSNVGAAVDQIDLNGGYWDLNVNDQSGYLGPLAETDAPQGAGVIVGVVGPGTPAAAAGLQPGDIISSLAGQDVADVASYKEVLQQTRPDSTVQVVVTREGQKLPPMNVALVHRPLHLVSRELNENGGYDQPSLLMTLAQLGDQRLAAGDVELNGLELRTGRWDVRNVNQDEIEFVWPLAKQGLEIVKRIRLARDPAGAANEQGSAPPLPGYHVELDIEIRNTGSEPLDVAYQLDGPTGLPTEGWWYASKISRQWWHSVGVRDLAVKFLNNEPQLIGAVDIATGDIDRTVRPDPLSYIGIDAQYFSAVLQPLTEKPEVSWLSDAQAIVVGPIPEDKARLKLTNTSCRLTSQPLTLAPGEAGLRQTWRMFAGPKRPEVLAAYNLEDLIYFGWPIFAVVSRFLLTLLHFFHDVVGNYGLAIIMLTVLVRGCMFPISRKQALSAQKMQELQPEMKKLNEKYKTQPEQRTKATQELFRKHNYNPFSGCLLVFLQLPIFMGLYRGLMISVELRQQPLIPGLRWASDLAAPDMLFRWSEFLPAMLAAETGWLGPFFNILPVVTVGLFLWQQKMFMPPPADEQAAMQQKMMKYMMIFMAVMFFKVASGLCLYFIASSLWSITERKMLPKPKSPSDADDAPVAQPAPARGKSTGKPTGNGEKPSGNGAWKGRKKKGPSRGGK
jgi:YidC/Oxa1 family membrane protein insertase